MVAAVRRAQSWWRQHPVWGWTTLGALVIVGVLGGYLTAAGLTDQRVPTGALESGGTAWTTSPSGSVASVLDDPAPLSATADGDYAIQTTNAGWWTASYAAFGVPAGATITAVRVYGRIAGATASGAKLYPRLRVGGTYYPLLAAPPTAEPELWEVASTAFLDHVTSWTTNPNTGLAWTRDDVNGTGANPLQGFGVYVTDANPDVYVSQLYVEVDYTPGVIVTVGNNTDPTTPTMVSPADTDVLIDGFSLTSTSGGTVNSVTVTRGAGTASVDAVKIYLDGNSDGSLSAAELAAPIGSGTFGSPIAITGQAVSATPKYYFVGVDASASQAGDNSVTGTVTSAAGTVDITSFLYQDTTSLTVNVQRTIVLVATGADPATPVTVSPGDTDVAIDSFTLSRSQGLKTPTVNSVTVDKTETGSAAVSSVKIYSDNGDGVLSAGEIGAGAIGTGVFGSAFALAPAQAMGGSYIVAVDIGSGATDGATITGRVSAIGGTNIDASALADTTSLTVTVQHTIVAVGDGTSLSTPVDVTPGQSGVVVDSFTLARSQGLKTPTVTSVTVTKSGTALISSLAIYSDGDTLGIIDGTDAPITTGSFGAPITINQLVDSTKSYLVVVTIDPGATSPSSVSGTATAAIGTSLDSFTYGDTTSRTANVVIAATPAQVTIGDGTDPAGATIAPTVVQIINAFTIERTAGSAAATVDFIRITKSGTSTAPSSVTIYTDPNGDGSYADGLVVGSGTFTANLAEINNFVDQAVPAVGSPASYLVVYNISGAQHGQTFDGRVSYAEASGSPAPTIAYAPDSGNTFTVSDPALVTIGDGNDPAGATVAPSAAQHVDSFTIVRTGGTAATSITDLTITRTAGTAAPTALTIYVDANRNGVYEPGTDTANVGTGTFSGSTAAVDLVDQLVGVKDVPAYYLIVYNISSATNGQTFDGYVTAAVGTGTPAPAFTFSDNGDTFTVAVTPDTEAPSVPTGVTATAGAVSPIIATISWTAATDNIGVTGYKIWRDTSATGGFTEVIGTTALLTFDDTIGVVGQEYFYKVSAYDAAGNESVPSAATDPGVTAVWTPAELPHDTYTAATNLCSLCHDPHVAATTNDILEDFGGTAGELSVCYSCHDGSGALTDIKNGADNSFSLASGHTLEGADPATDLTNACSGCHSPHRDYHTNPRLAKTTVNGVAVSAADNTWCLACHNAENDWFGAGYALSVDATGYPIEGTFPTDGVNYIAYTDSAFNVHLAIPAVSGETTRTAGDCLYCHSSHRGVGAYDGLTARFQPSTAATLAQDQSQGDYATLCFQCHGTTAGGVLAQPVAGATNIQQFVTAGGQRSGHRIETAGGTYPVGSPLPCYECHNPHGSARENKHMFSDALGGSLDTTTVASPTAAQAAQTRQFCFTCHTTADVGPGLKPYGWDSGSTSYVEVTAGAKSAGLLRDAALGANVLRLPDANGHYRADADDSCYKCHGSNYGSATANNVHNPSGGVSQGGEPCYGCHTQYQASMEDGTAPKIGDQRASSFHHVMGGNLNNGAYQDGDYAPGAGVGAYPSSGLNEFFCVTCHVDHDQFNSDPGKNLRQQFTDPTPTASANTDFSGTLPMGGICLSCHGAAMGKSTLGVDQASDGTMLTQAVASGPFDTSAHEYPVTSYFGTSAFEGNCVKCHNDEQAKEFATSAIKFGVHWSASARIISAFGGTPAANLSPEHCYGCHSVAADGIKSTDGYDNYGAAQGAAMSAASERLYARFEVAGDSTAGGSRHPAGLTDGDAMMCDSCHNVHRVKKPADGSSVSNPDNTYALALYSSDADRSAFCLKCHDGSGAPKPVPPDARSFTEYVPIDVLMSAPGANKSTYGAKGHWSTTGAISAAEQVNCAECHDKHASTEVKLLGAYDATDGRNEIAGTEITANNNTVCYACHAAASNGFPALEVQRDASGYLNAGTWPGSGVYLTLFNETNHTGSPHTDSEATNGYGAGDCKNCHNVHGTAYAYDETVKQFDPTSTGDDQFALCLDCHDGTKGADIDALYPVAAGGESTGLRSGHRVLSTVAGATLAKDQAVPCYDCHNPHGSGSPYSLQVRDIGDVAGEGFDDINSGTAALRAAAVRKFCFTCHATSDTITGWDGAGYVGVGTTTVEGIARNGYKLGLAPWNSTPEHRQGSAADCFGCHSNPHEPTGGVSVGGAECFACHSDKDPMLSDATTFHHVLDDANPDQAPGAGAYPTSESVLACVSCHTDHNNFNAAKGSNLRASINSNSGATASRSDTDFIAGNGAAGNYDDGICLGCHYASITKSTSQKVSVGAETEAPLITDEGYNASAHQYQINDATKVGYGASAFRANCTKCHDDEQDGVSKQTGAYKIGTHYSARQHLLSALGGTPDANGLLAEEHCYGCHTGGATGNDFYGVQAMTQAAKSTEAQFALTSRHPVASADQATGDAVECESCHNPHVVRSTAGNRVSDPDNGYSLAAYTAVADKAAFCLKCHDATAATDLPQLTIDGTKYIPYTVTQANRAVNNKSTYAAKGHSTAVGAGAISTAEAVACGTCHDNHGSIWPKLLGVFDPANPAANPKIGTASIAGNDNTVCSSCHTNATGTAYSRLANGYPNIGTWPGDAVYTGTNGIHKGISVTTVSGDCKVCHDIHGTQYAYDELVAQFDPTNATVDNYKLCFDCHDGSPSTKNIRQYYPSGDGGTADGGNYGHSIKTAGGTLAIGQGLPCYECHNPHGSAEPDGLLVETMINGTRYLMGDASTEIGTISAAAGDAASVRRFCFLCHATAAGEGTTSAGTGYTAAAGIKATDLIVGLSRTGANKLQLSSGTAEHLVGASGNCFDCHGGMTETSASNVHNPSGGAGNDNCLVCHGASSVEKLHNMLPSGTLTYHHVLDSTTPDEWDTAYPASQSVLECRSCHVDHRHFNGAASNLRGAYNDSPAAGSGKNTDFQGGAGGFSVCMSCHTTAQTKDPATGQKSDTTSPGWNSATTPAMSSSAYDASAHDYQINDAAKVGYGAGQPFLANCLKCHDDGATGPSGRQKGTVRLAPHFSADNRIAQALGAAIPAGSNSTEENLCYECHSLVANGFKATNDLDGYATAGVAMSANSQAIYGEFQKTSKHPVGTSAGLHKSDEGAASGWNPASARHAECEDCHNIHAAQTGVTTWPSNAAPRGATMPSTGAGIPSGSTAGVWGVTFGVGTVTSSGWTGYGTFGNPTTLAASNYSVVSAATYQWQICLKCHSTYAWTTTAPTVSLNLQGQTGGRQTDVGNDFNDMNYSVHPVLAEGKNQPPATGGSANPNWTSTTYAGQRNINGTGLSTYGLSNTFTDGWLTTSRTVCTDCHRSNSWTSPSGPHGSTNKWLLSGVDTNIKVTIRNGTVTTPNSTAVTDGWAGNFCMNCHRKDVYGSGINGSGTTDCVYGVLSRFNHDALNAQCGEAGQMDTQLQWSGCVNCHGGRKDQNSYGNPANTVVQSGAIHGVTMTEQTGNAGADPMGYRFMNGASWAGHTLADSSGTSPTCYTLGTADNYSNCTAHGGGRGANNSIMYSYPRPTN